MNSDLYVPYTVCSNRLQNGDLIDLSCAEEECCLDATLEQVWHYCIGSSLVLMPPADVSYFITVRVYHSLHIITGNG